jgi:hypothetical protein
MDAFENNKKGIKAVNQDQEKLTNRIFHHPVSRSLRPAGSQGSI